MGWAGISNGELLRRAAQSGFDALPTADRNLEYQQDVAKARVAIIILIAPTNRIEDLEPLGPRALQALAESRPGQIGRVER